MEVPPPPGSAREFSSVDKMSSQAIYQFLLGPFAVSLG